MSSQLGREDHPALSIQLLLERASHEKSAQLALVVVEDAHLAEDALHQPRPLETWNRDEAIVDPPPHDHPGRKGLSQSSGNCKTKAIVQIAFMSPGEKPPQHGPTLPHITPHDNAFWLVSCNRAPAWPCGASVAGGVANTCSRPNGELLFPS